MIDMSISGHAPEYEDPKDCSKGIKDKKPIDPVHDYSVLFKTINGKDWCEMAEYI